MSLSLSLDWLAVDKQTDLLSLTEHVHFHGAY